MLEISVKELWFSLCMLIGCDVGLNLKFIFTKQDFCNRDKFIKLTADFNGFILADVIFVILIFVLQNKGGF